MKKNKGITLVALVITIIILLILAGITISLTVGENGIIRKAQEAGRNYQNAAEYEKIALDELINTTDSIIGDVTNNDKKPYDESEFRKLIAQAITEEGVATTWEDRNDIFVENIGKILQERTKDATASANDILAGKTAYANGEKVTGTATKEMNIGTIQMRAYGLVDINVQGYNRFSCTYYHSGLFSSTCDATIQIIGINASGASTYIVNAQRVTSAKTLSNIDISNYSTIRIISSGSNYQDTIKVTNMVIK